VGSQMSFEKNFYNFKMLSGKKAEDQLFIQVDEEGFFHFNQRVIEDDEYGQHLFSHMEKCETGVFQTDALGSKVIVESFDAPIIAKQVYRESDKYWCISAPYEYRAHFILESLSLDEWGRFHGETSSSIPFVMSGSAQSDFLGLIDECDNKNIIFEDQRFEMPDWLVEKKESEKEVFWDHIYQTETPHWELEQPAPPLVAIHSQLKLKKSRVLVLGCGSGNDAAYFALQGHLVTGVDISIEAINRAEEKYSSVKNLNFIHSDLFDLGEGHYGQYDIVFEHTCYCCINPVLRNKLVKLWVSLLNEGGRLMGIFFVMDQRTGPPFGGSEWEVRERLKKDFDFLCWTRWRHSFGRRTGKELLVYAAKKT
jgi:SAM-dependent methyltransferase